MAGAGSKVMRQHAIEHALKRADHCDFSNIIDRRGVLVRPAAALLVGLAAAYFCYYHWTFTCKAMARLIDPFGVHSWTQIDLDQAPPMRLAQGQRYTIKGQLTGTVCERFVVVISRATFKAPERRPEPSQTGDTVTETSMISPSFRRRCVSKYSSSPVWKRLSIGSLLMNATSSSGAAPASSGLRSIIRSRASAIVA